MKIYIHKGNGYYVGSRVIVLAHNEQEAREMIRTKLNEMGLRNESIDKLKEVSTGKKQVVDYDNGDY